jgi:hypothetical protein
VEKPGPHLAPQAGRIDPTFARLKHSPRFTNLITGG